MREIASGLWEWSVPHPEWKPGDLEDGAGWEQVVSSYALAGDGLVLFDPLVEDWDALDALVERHGPPAILLTILWHGRSAPDILERYAGAATWAHEPAAEWVEERTPVTKTFQVGDSLPAGTEAIHMRRIEEVAFWLPAHRAVVVGDTILGHGERAALCPPTWVRKSETFEPARQAVRELMAREPATLLLTHGGPMSPEALDVDV
jgi:glyoxylase-like metal-dependent hydrolase (beta-lactamase superfamily II)